jgi:succinylarginine dihydrolase
VADGQVREVNFDGLVGPTHNYGGLSAGNVASMRHGGLVSSPKAAALQGLEKMAFVASLGVPQAVLPPHPRPSVSFLRRLGFGGSDAEVIADAATRDEQLLRIASSAAAMWTANAATVAPSADTADGRLHLVPANLHTMLHRAIEADTTRATLTAIFSDASRFAVHGPLPGGGQLADEGAANHTRLAVPGRPAVHVFGWGRSFAYEVDGPRRFPARQTLEASRAVARLLALDAQHVMFARQDPVGIDAGAFHTDVLAVGTEGLLLLHERAFVDPDALLRSLEAKLGDGFRWVMAREDELPVRDAVRAYPFNSQLVRREDGALVIVAPEDSRALDAPRRFLERVVAEDVGVAEVFYRDVRQSMNNGGGPACLRLRVPMTDDELGALGARVRWERELGADLEAWVERHYRPELRAEDLMDPELWVEVMTALDELTGILRLGSVYDFQQAGR